MAAARVAHRELIDNLQQLNTFGKQRAAAALLAGDFDHDRRVEPGELAGVMRAVARDAQLNDPSRNAVINAIQEAYTRLASPASCKVGVPHQKVVESLDDLNAFGKQRAAAAMFAADFNADLCLTESELPAAVRAIARDAQMNDPSRNAVSNSLQLAFVRLKPPASGIGGFAVRAGAPMPKTMVSE